MPKRTLLIYNGDATPREQIQTPQSASPEEYAKVPVRLYSTNGELVSEVNDSASPQSSSTAVAWSLDTENAISETGSNQRLLSIRNGGTEAFGFYRNSASVISGKATTYNQFHIAPEGGTTYLLRMYQFGAMTIDATSSLGMVFNNYATGGTANRRGVSFFCQNNISGSGSYLARFANDINGTPKNLYITTAGGIQADSGLGIHGTTPPSQHSSTGNTSVTAAGSTNAVYRNTTFTGGSGTKAYTIGDVVLALKNVGLMAAS